MSKGKHAYGAIGRIGVGTPQANPTVEPEFSVLLPRACSVHVTRLTSGAASPEHRLMQYLWNLERFLAAFDELRPDVFGFACTGSSYLVGAVEEERLINAAQAAYGYPVATAARAIIWGLSRLRARRIAMIAPYPDTLITKAKEYWSDAGLDIVRSLRMPTASTDTRSIYALGSERLSNALREIPTDGVDAVLVCGTGLASLPAIRDCELSIPVVSSNVCLAGQVLSLAGHGELLEADSPFPQRWRERLGEALVP